MTDALFDVLTRPPDVALEGFLALWHDVTSDFAEQPVPLGTPPALRRLYQVATVAPGFCAQNRLLTLAQLAEYDGHLVFYEENQSVVYWGIEADAREAVDPPVWCRENASGRPWVQDAPAVSVFAIQIAVLEGAMGAPHFAASSGLPEPEVTDVLSSFRALPLPAWDFGPSQFFASENALAVTLPAVPSESSVPLQCVFIGAREARELTFLQPRLTSELWHTEDRPR
jgi:hypothetical protein